MRQLNTDNYISDADADRLIAAHDGDMALLYIYRLRTGQKNDEKAAADLFMTLRAVREAGEKLERFTSAETAAVGYHSHAPEPSDEIPEYNAEDILRRSEGDSQFSAILSEAAQVMGKPVSSPDMKLLFGVYDHLGIPASVLMMLINYCGMVYEKRYAGQRRPTMHAIEKEAVQWANMEIMSIEAAEDYIERQKERSGILGRVKELMGIHGRQLVKSEAERIGSWLDMGFGEEAIAIAFERTVTNTGGLKWNYMDKIIRSWNEKKLFTPQQIEEKDGKSRTRVSGTGNTFTEQKLDLAKLDKVLDKI